MTDLRGLLEETPLDPDAELRAWRVVRAAHAERTPARRRVPFRAATLVAAVGAAIAAAALSPPGRAVVNAVRRSIGIEHAAPALFRLPAPGRLLVSGPSGAWVVSADGSSRRLGSYPQATWSPHALYVAVAAGDELAAVEPDGNPHWALARPGIELPAWGGTRTDTRVAYLSRGLLHAVGGDGRGDVVLGRAARVRPAWRPSHPEQLVLAWVTAAGRVVVGTPGRSPLWRSAPLDPLPRLLAWAPDGSRLAVATSTRLLLLDGRTGSSVGIPLRGIRALAYAPDGRLAVVRGRSVLLAGGDGPAHALFSAPGLLSGLAWSPDGRWLLTALPGADQWIFVQTRGGHRVLAVSNIRRELGGPVSLDGWAPGT
jgi:WD domain, G-beta repeat